MGEVGKEGGEVGKVGEVGMHEGVQERVQGIRKWSEWTSDQGGREGGRKRGRKGRREGGRKGRWEGGRKGRREEGKEEGREYKETCNTHHNTKSFLLQ